MKRPGNPLALAVLTLLYERPMHPYEMSTTLRFRHKEDSIKINYGSLYAVVESLEKKGLIRATERIRDGRRPERTVYALTASGESAMRDWLGELISVPTHQFTDFEAALSLLAGLPPEEVRSLLAERLRALHDDDRAYRDNYAALKSFPRLFAVESEYRAAMRRAEIDFATALLGELTDGTFEGLASWRRLHDLKRADSGVDLLATAIAEFFPDGTTQPPRS